MIIARPTRSIESCERLFAVTDCCDPLEGQLAGRPVDERRAEEQHGGAEPADHEVLQARLERALPARVDRAEDVERDREPLQAEEERHQRVRLDEEDHPAARRGEQAVVLGDVALGALAVGDEHGDEARESDDYRAEREEPVAPDGVRDHALAGGRAVVDEDGEDEGGDEPAGGEDGGGRAAAGLRNEDGDEQAGARDGEQRQRRRDREPVDRRAWDRGGEQLSHRRTPCP